MCILDLFLIQEGLTPLKWAIFEDEPIGGTTHFLGKEVDVGETIERREVIIHNSESFCIYYNEIDMLAGTLGKLDEPH